MGYVPRWPRREAGVAGQVTGTRRLLWLYLNNRPLSDYHLAYVDADKKECLVRLNRHFLNHSSITFPLRLSGPMLSGTAYATCCAMLTSKQPNPDQLRSKFS
jgi:hypothetical protein